MGNISYTIVNGGMPITAELIPSSIPANIHLSAGTYTFVNVPNGSYTLTITDSNECVFEQDIVVDPNVTTTTTTIYDGSLIVVGQNQNVGLIFNENTTNRDTHYVGYPNVNVIELYLWFKTANGAPLTTQKVINYSIIGGSGNVFTFNELSDQIHTEVVESVNASNNISGNIIFKTGFIESFFKYTYNKNISDPDYQINLTSILDWAYTNIMLTDVNNPYGIVSINNTNVVMNF